MGTLPFLDTSVQGCKGLLTSSPSPKLEIAERDLMKKKFKIEVSKGNEHWLISCDYLDIYASGITFKEALQDYFEIYTYMTKYYKKLKKKDCIGLALKLKKRLKGLS